MITPIKRSPIYLPPDDKAAVFDALAEAMLTAASYADTAAQFASLRDPKGAAYATRCASAALIVASELLAEVRPAQQGGRAA